MWHLAILRGTPTKALLRALDWRRFIRVTSFVLGVSALLPSAGAEELVLGYAVSIGGSGTDVGQAVVVDDSGNVYWVGHFEDIADFDPGRGVYNLASNGQRDVFICKLDPFGALVWVGTIGGTGDDFGVDIALDHAGNILVTGAFSGAVDFDMGSGEYIVTSKEFRRDAFVCKYDASGIIQWAQAIGGETSNDGGESIAFDDADNVYVFGEYRGVAVYGHGPGAIEFGGPDEQGLFVMKLNGSGAFQWAGVFGDSFSDRPSSVAVDGGEASTLQAGSVALEILTLVWASLKLLPWMARKYSS